MKSKYGQFEAILKEAAAIRRAANTDRMLVDIYRSENDLRLLLEDPDFGQICFLVAIEMPFEDYPWPIEVMGCRINKLDS